MYSAVPGPPENFIVEALNYTTVKLSWQSPILENGIILYYTITYNGSREELTDVRVYMNTMIILFRCMMQ